MEIWSVGHGARPLEDFLAVLADAHVTTLVDVRSQPGLAPPVFGDILVEGLEDLVPRGRECLTEALGAQAKWDGAVRLKT